MSAQFNPAKSTSYYFTVTNNRNISLKLQNTSLGSVNLGVAPFATRYSDLNLPDNKLEFGPMTLRFLVSEDFTEWFDIYRWMNDIIRTNDSHLSKVEDGELTILNASNIPIIRVVYKGVYPISLGDLLYSVSDDETSLVCDLVIQYDTYDVENLLTGEKIKYGMYD